MDSINTLWHVLKRHILIYRLLRKEHTPATPAIINHQTDLIADYVEDYGHTIWFDEMLDELNRYTDENKRKFDIVASMAMAELADEELGSIVPSKIIKEEDIITT